MDEPTAQTSEQTLPGLIRFTLEQLRNLRLKGPPNFQHEQYAEVWQALAAAGNSLTDQIENLRVEGHEQWETGDEASIQQFGRFAVPQGKEFMRNVLRELGSLGTFEADDVEKEDVEQESLKEGVIQKEVIGRKAIKTEAVETPLQDTALPSIECRSTLLFLPENQHILNKNTATNSFKTPTVPRPADYKTPPRGPSFSPITPPQPNNVSSSTVPPHPPLQYPDDQRFQSYLSSINFNDDENPHSMFDLPTPTDVQREISPPPQLASQSASAPEAPTEQEYMASVRLVVENIESLVFLMLPEPEGRSRVIG